MYNTKVGIIQLYFCLIAHGHVLFTGKMDSLILDSLILWAKKQSNLSAINSFPDWHSNYIAITQVSKTLKDN